MSYPANVLPAMMQRALKNLEFVRLERQRRKAIGIDVDEEGPFEITQLVNSVRCAFAHPWKMLLKPERDLKKRERSPELPLIRQLARHLTDPDAQSPNETDVITLLGYVRNAFAHGNIEFLSRESGFRDRRDIYGIRIWNCRFEEKTKNWERIVTEDQLNELLNHFIEIANKLYDPRTLRNVKDCLNDPN